MGLEQLSDEQLEELITELELCGIYGRQVRALAELQEYRKAMPAHEATDFQVSDAIAHMENEADMVLVPRGLLGAAAGAIRHPRHEAGVTLGLLRHYSHRKPITPQPAPPLKAVTVPDGWKLVPTELTDVMRDAWDSAPNGEDDDLNMQNAFRAMIAAAPKFTNEP
jgi:hypothetical protein